jgi:long-chain-fatty-acid--CoA ligase ACSBG
MLGSCLDSGAPPITLWQGFKHTVKLHGDKHALATKPNHNSPYSFVTWNQYYDNCINFGKCLCKLEMQPHASVTVLGFNSPQWFYSLLGCVAAGGIAAGIYTTNLKEACSYIITHSEAEVICLDDDSQLDKIVAEIDKCPSLKCIVQWLPTGKYQSGDMIGHAKYYTYDDFIEWGSSRSEGEVEERAAAQKPGQCASLIYTSGTTGPPKAVMISHDNAVWTSHAAENVMGGGSVDDRLISYLPLSHIAAQMLDIYLPVLTGACVYFALPDALKGTLAIQLQCIKPTLFFGVPRVWEKIYEKMMEVAKKIKGPAKKAAAWAKSLGLERNERAQYGHDEGGLPLSWIMAHLILKKIHKKLGLNKCRGCFTGAAPISEKILRYFMSIDVPIYELFGQSECTGPHTMNAPGYWRVGTCGRALEGTEMRIDPQTGELQYRGRHIFMGYLKNEEETQKTIDPEGWLCSGDKAKVDEDGFMSITGRIKELIITAGGENIPPTLIEDNMKDNMKALSNCMCLGERQKFLTMLITLKVKLDGERPTNELDGDALDASIAMGSSATTVQQAKECPKWKEYIDAGTKAANKTTTSNAQVVQKWYILEQDFSVDGGELTPTMKLKRPVVTKQYEDIIKGTLYGDLYAE